ncbi:hypothetical protein AB1Y20_004938 [Prymnesium parvum]|uniref:Dolichyl-phosphate-mannose--protein mannosyltransferase n=1 Tax=Prymnesium parvum TaxID=97485 RepID=A0AB34J3X3_PRYPA
MRQRSGPVGCLPPPASPPAPSPSPPPPPSPPSDGLCLLFAVLGVASRFCCLCWPAQVVFDEFHFGKFVSSYVRREYFFDIHPPLAKLLLALAAKAAAYAGEQPFLSIGEPYLRHVPLFALRALPAAAGAAAPPLAYRLCRALRASRAAAALAAAAVLLDGALLVEARLLLTDSLLFGAQIGALLFALEARHCPAASRAFLANLAAAGAMIGCAVSIKWTALATMAMVGIDSVVSLILTAHASLHDDSSAYSRQWRTSVLIGSRTSVALRCSLLFRALRPAMREFAARFVLLLLLPLAIYVFSFVAHFHAVPHYGPGGVFHGLDFNCRLLPPHGVALTPELLAHRACRWRGCAACAEVEPLSVWGAIVSLNRRMLSANAAVTKTHAFGSRFHEWPFNSQPVFYWRHGGDWCKIYCAGNSFIWLLALVGSSSLAAFLLHDLALSLLAARPKRFSIRPPRRRCLTPLGLRNASLLLAGYLLAWLPFALVERVAFLYHYIPAFLLALFASALAFDAAADCLAPARGALPIGPFPPRRAGLSCPSRSWVALLLVALMLASAAFFLPIHIGLPLPQEMLARRVHLLDVRALAMAPVDRWRHAEAPRSSSRLLQEQAAAGRPRAGHEERHPPYLNQSAQ